MKSIVIFKNRFTHTVIYGIGIVFNQPLWTSMSFVYSIVLLLLVSFNTPVSSQTVRVPFPQHTSYCKGSTKPSHITQHELDQNTIQFYQQWKKIYLQPACNKGEYYILFDEIPSASVKEKDISVSEAQGYGMLIMTYMAGYDTNACKFYNGLYRFYRSHATSDNQYLMAWRQKAGCIVHPDDNSSSTDADIDIAFSLLLADRQWGSAGEINYRDEATHIINAIYYNEINRKDNIINLGNQVFREKTRFNDMRSSDFIPVAIRAFYSYTSHKGWPLLLDKGYYIFNDLQVRYSPSTGLIPDFIENCNTSLRPSKPNYFESEYDSCYYYNACRVPMRITMDFLLYNEIRAKEISDKITDWLTQTTHSDTSLIRAGYYLDGAAIPGHDFISPAFIGPFAVAAMTDIKYQDWLNMLWDYLQKFKIEDNKYYDNTLKMLCMIILSGNVWTI